MFGDTDEITLPPLVPDDAAEIACDACGFSAVDGVLGVNGVFCTDCVQPAHKIMN